MIREKYVQGVRLAASAAHRTGVDRWLSRRDSRFASHLHSLLAIYDVERMISLDVPWWTYKAAAEVDGILQAYGGTARVFEYGSGSSTLWLGQRAAEVVSVEHDAAFVEILRPLLKPFEHIDLRCVTPGARRPDSTAVSQHRGYEDCDFGEYVGAVAVAGAGGPFDLIVIDGRARAACLAAALGELAEGGVLVFDNASRPRYRAAIACSGLDEDLKRGWVPSLPYRDATSLLRRPR